MWLYATNYMALALYALCRHVIAYGYGRVLYRDDISCKRSMRSIGRVVSNRWYTPDMPLLFSSVIYSCIVPIQYNYLSIFERFLPLSFLSLCPVNAMASAHKRRYYNKGLTFRSIYDWDRNVHNCDIRLRMRHVKRVCPISVCLCRIFDMQEKAP